MSEQVSEEEQRGRMRGSVGSRGNVTILSPVTRTDVWGDEVEDWGLKRGAGGRSERPPLRESREETKMQEEGGRLGHGNKREEKNHPGDRRGGR